MTDMWELTPHSTQYYHSTATFAGNGMVTALQLVSPSLYTMNYTLDGEGRWNTLAQNSMSIVTGPAYPTPMYNAASQATEVDLTDGDKDLYTYSPYTGRMTQYEFEVGGANETGVLTWNANNTLQSLAITDGFNAGGSQTCASSYDDLARLAVFDCGSGNWGQDFGYDQYDNLTQTVISGRSGSTWNPGYSSSNNHVTGATYDASGDMTSDGGMNVYGWNWFNKLAWTAGSGTPSCGTNGKCITYDAFGRMVEKSTGAAWSEIWYTQVPGSQIYMSGATANYGYWPSPGRGTFIASGTNMFFHQDWLGNDRVVSAVSLHTVSADRAYAPYGEQYNTFGSTNPIYGMFAGITGDFDSGVLFDTPNRELAQYQGRWLSPDPAGVGWNQYAYPTNPNSAVDPSGLQPLPIQNNGASWEYSTQMDELVFDQLLPGVPSNSVLPGGGTVGADAGSPTTSPSAPQLCSCLDDVTSGALSSTIDLSSLNFGSTNPWAFTFEFPPLVFNSSDSLNGQAVLNEVGAMAGADEDLILIGGSSYALAAAGGACVAGGAGCVAVSLVGANLVNDFYGAMDPGFEEQPANAPVFTGHDPGSEPVGPSQGPAQAPITGPPPTGGPQPLPPLPPVP